MGASPTSVVNLSAKTERLIPTVRASAETSQFRDGEPCRMRSARPTWGSATAARARERFGLRRGVRAGRDVDGRPGQESHSTGRFVLGRALAARVHYEQHRRVRSRDRGRDARRPGRPGACPARGWRAGHDLGDAVVEEIPINCPFRPRLEGFRVLARPARRPRPQRVARRRACGPALLEDARATRRSLGPPVAQLASATRTGAKLPRRKASFCGIQTRSRTRIGWRGCGRWRLTTGRFPPTGRLRRPHSGPSSPRLCPRPWRVRHRRWEGRGSWCTPCRRCRIF